MSNASVGVTSSRPPVRARRSVKTAALHYATPAQIGLTVGFVVVHVPLAMLMRSFPEIATVHAIACLLVGLVFAATTRRILNVSMVVAYFAGCEVLWRMTKAEVFWEFGKYATVAVLLVALARIQSRRNRTLALVYFGLLVPSIALTFVTLDLDAARQEVSFNLSGPLALAVAVVFFSNIRLGTSQLRGTYFALIAPVVGIGALSFVSTASVGELAFANGSNYAASGGFGPNQVSAILGLAVMVLLLLSLDRRLPWRMRLPMIVLAAALGAQAVLTFARGGILLAFAGICGALFILVGQRRRGRLSVVMVGLLSVVLAKYVIEPRLDDLTKGKLSERYTDTRSSGRDLFISSELEIFQESPVLGVGPGVGMYLRKERDLFKGPSHTEYTRMLAEHGIFGIFAIGCLIVLGARAIRQCREPASRATATAMVIWAALFLAIYGTRLAAPALVFGLAFALRPVLPSARQNGPVRGLVSA